MTKIARIAGFFYCKDIKMGEDKVSFETISPLNAVIAESTPVRTAINMILSLHGISGDEDHEFYVAFYDPDENEITKTEPFIIPKESDTEPEEEDYKFAMMLGIELGNVLIEQTGTFYTRIYYDNEPIGEYPIPILEGDE